jgi:hypothetical protein
VLQQLKTTQQWPATTKQRSIPLSCKTETLNYELRALMSGGNVTKMHQTVNDIEFNQYNADIQACKAETQCE